MAAGNPPSIYTSPDGIAWTPRATGISQTISRIERLRDSFIAVGQFGTLLTSTNGTNWSRRLSRTSYSLGGIAYLPHSFVVAGANGRILQSGALLDLSEPSFQGPTFSLNFTAHPDTSVALETSLDLIHWNEITSAPPATGSESNADPSALQIPAAFYRTRINPPTP